MQDIRLLPYISIVDTHEIRFNRIQYHDKTGTA